MFRVSDFMTRNPITVSPDEKISAAIDLMRFNKIHRIPVVDANNRLAGLITEGMIAAGSNNTSLDIYELNYLLSKTDVRTVMVKHPISISENALMEQAADKLLAHDIGCLPVVNDANEVTGILTQNDIFHAFLDMLAWDRKGTRIIVQVPEGVGVIEKLGHLFTEQDISISSIGVYDLSDDHAELLVKTNGSVEHEPIRQLLEDNGFTVLGFEEV